MLVLFLSCVSCCCQMLMGYINDFQLTALTKLFNSSSSYFQYFPIRLPCNSPTSLSSGNRFREIPIIFSASLAEYLFSKLIVLFPYVPSPFSKSEFNSANLVKKYFLYLLPLILMSFLNRQFQMQ